MNMRLTVLAAALMATGSVSAQNVTLYGLMDTGIEHVSNANAAGKSMWRMPSVTGSVPSRWGLRGSEDLGGGLKALFTLESGFNVDAGTQGQAGRLFGRQAFVGLTGAFGTVTLGRQNTMLFYAMMDGDVIGPNIYGLGSLDSYLPNARADNSIAYRGTFSGLTVGATYSLGRDVAGGAPLSGTCAGESSTDRSACREWSALLKYDQGPFGVAAAYDEQRGGAGAAAFFFNGAAAIPMTSSSDKDRRLTINGYARFGDLKVTLGWLARQVKTTGPDVDSNLYFASAGYAFTGSLGLDAQIARIVNSDQDRDGTLLTLRGTYSLSKRTAVYATASYLKNSEQAQYSVSSGGGGTTPAPGKQQIGTMVGIRHAF
jgi:predicted porin